ncbi:metal-dependent hydrolase [Mycobacteroides abscessus subsp. abscessus]|uniref:metal-dependent hydrolase n=1 Tax=Mycobacteroides abscessus TaxID=36809 RepID=UPI000925F44B|nr:metal-dependent hydrolase [Mycobacteroides abscessus]SIL80658.1 metal-dependent hydrolase [Mycobacteroides abscessus subsp. abscessus]SLF08313.1 metal-dependent hydrolase [Mycobacteroides abscessus subsp. abscessus]
MSTSQAVALTVAEDVAGEVVVRPRPVEFDLSRVPLHWIPSDPILSHAYSVAHIGLSLGERGFVDAFKRALPYVNDPDVREQMVGFIGQEGVHAETHNKAVWKLLQDNGIDVAPLIEEADYLYERAIGTIDALPERLRRRIVVQMLAGTAAGEHLTNTTCYYLLSHCDFEERGADSNVADLFRWHFSEEVEHRMVAWNVARYFGVGRGRLVPIYATAALGFIPALAIGSWLLARKDSTMETPSLWQVYRGFAKAMRTGGLPTWGVFMRALIDYTKKDFTPASTGNTAQAMAYLAQSRAVKKIAV